MDTRPAAEQAPASAAAGPDSSETFGPTGGSVTWAAALHVTSGGGITGFAWFDSDTSELWATQGSDDASFAFLKQALIHSTPRLVFLPQASSDEFVAATAEGMADCDTDGQHKRREVSKVTSSLFGLDACRGRLASVRIDDLPVGHTLNHLHSCLRLDADVQVRAGGALIACLQKDGLLPSSLASLREASLSNFLTLDDAARQALAIFTVDAHPDVLKQGRAAGKEGLCVASLLDTCLTPGGSRLLRSWLKRPLVDGDALNQRLGAVASLLGDDISAGCGGSDGSHALARALTRVRDVSRALDRLRVVAAFTPRTEWQGLCDSMSALLQVKDALAEVAAHTDGAASSLWTQLLGSMDDRALRSVYDLIAGVIDLQGEEDDADADATAEVDASAAHALLKSGVDAKLDGLKAEYEDLPNVLTRAAQGEMRRVQAHQQGGAQPRGLTLSVTYIPNVGHCIRIGMASGQGGPAPHGEALLPYLPGDYVYAFTGDSMQDPSSEEPTGGTGFFYLCDTTRGLDAQHGDLFHLILDTEAAILTALKARILDRAPALAKATQAACTADAVLALARAAHEHNLVRPVLTEDNVLVIRNGRHLLQERLVAGGQFIPNDTVIDDTAGRCLVISGPNSSGKSVHIKSVAVIVFLAHCGCFVPASSARIGRTDRIFVRMSTCGTSTAVGTGGTAAPCDPGGSGTAAKCAWLPRESSFVRDVHQVARILRLATPRSLILLDEFGSGTLSTDGVALLGATLAHLVDRDLPPRTLAVTHFSDELLAAQRDGLLPGEPMLQFKTMAVVTASAASDAVTFLYKLAPGTCTGSYGVHCARLAGVLPTVVARAQEISALVAAGAPVVPVQDDARMARRLAAYGTMVQALLDLNLNGDTVPDGDQERDRLRAWLRDVCSLAVNADDADDDTATMDVTEEAPAA